MRLFEIFIEIPEENAKFITFVKCKHRPFMKGDWVVIDGVEMTNFGDVKKIREITK